MEVPPFQKALALNHKYIDGCFVVFGTDCVHVSQEYSEGSDTISFFQKSGK